MTTSVQPGWYDDPEDSNAQRYWDGQNWTPHRQRKPVSPESSAPNLPPPPQSSAPNLPSLPPTYASNAAYPPPPNEQGPWLPPGQQPVGPPPQRSNNPLLVIGVIAVLVVLAVGGFLAYKHFDKSTPTSPEDQIKALVQHEGDDWNNSNFSYDPATDCKASASDYTERQAEKLRQLRAQLGTATASVANIQVTGDKATADTTLKFQNAPDHPLTLNEQFVNEDGRWKDCTPPDSDEDDDGN